MNATEEDQVRRWAPLAYRAAARYWLPGGDRDDVRQEALLGLLHGLRAYRPAQGPLVPFLELVIHRRLGTAVRDATTAGAMILTRAGRATVDDEGDRVDLIDLEPDDRLDVPRIAELRERVADLRERVASLSPIEREVLTMTMNGHRYHRGGIDRQATNALQRARAKLAA